jgi:hypothetical protein
MNATTELASWSDDCQRKKAVFSLPAVSAAVLLPGTRVGVCKYRSATDEKNRRNGVQETFLAANHRSTGTCAAMAFTVKSSRIV